jgi:hydrogenase expression/formation protein HypC
MCVAIPGRVVSIGDPTEVSIPGVVELPQGHRDVDLVMTPEARVGDHVVIHSGYAIRIVPGDDEMDRAGDGHRP